MIEMDTANAFSTLLFEVGTIIILTLFIAYIFKKIGIPAVMAILLGGFVVGLNEEFRAFLLADSLESFRLFITELAMGYIAYDIGNEIDLQVWKDRIPKYLPIIAGETVIPFIVTTVFFIVFQQMPIGLAMIIGAIAMTSAPVIISEILGDYHTDDELSQLVLFLLAFDSVIGIIVINIAITIVSVIPFSVSLIENIIYNLVWKLSVSLVLSLLGSIFISFLLQRSHLEERSLIEWLLGVSLVIIGMTLTLNGSVILTMLLFGIMLKTMESKYQILEEHVVQIEILLVPVVLLFYIIMGLIIDLSISLPLILWYFVLRFISKFGGTFCVTRISKVQNKIKNNLHYFLITQGGIAIALASLAYNQLLNIGMKKEALLIVTIITVGVILSEVVGPIFLRYGLAKSQREFFKNLNVIESQ